MQSLSLKDHYQNQKFNNLHEFFWGFGSAFHTVYAVVPLFLKELGSPEVIATSSAGLFSIIIAMPMLLIAALTRNITNMKKMVISVHCLILLVAFLMGYVFTFSKFGVNPNAWKIYFSLFIAYALSIGIIVPIWADFLEKTTKRSLRGKFFVAIVIAIAVIITPTTIHGRRPRRCVCRGPAPQCALEPLDQIVLCL